MNQEPMDKEPMDKESMKQELMKQELMKQELVNQICRDLSLLAVEGIPLRAIKIYSAYLVGSISYYPLIFKLSRRIEEPYILVIDPKELKPKKELKK